MVVDQDEDILASTYFLLNAWGFDALPARSIQEVETALSREGEGILCALIDYHLSETETGLQVAQTLREKARPNLPVAIVTGDTTKEVMAAVRDANLALMHKPVDARTIQDFVAGAQKHAVLA